MGTDCQSSKFEPLDGYRLPILPSELLTTSRSLEAGSGKVFFKEDDLEVLRVRLPCPNIKLAICSRTLGNLFAHFNMLLFPRTDCQRATRACDRLSSSK